MVTKTTDNRCDTIKRALAGKKKERQYP